MRLMVAMVSPASLLPAKTLVVVPGPKDFPRIRGSSSGLNSESPEHSDMQPPAEMPCLLSEKGFVLGGHLHRCLKT